MATAPLPAPILVPGTSTLAPAVRLVLARVASPESRRVYGRAFRSFGAFCRASGRSLSRETVLLWLEGMTEQGYAPATVNLYLTVIRRLAREASIAGLMSPADADLVKMIEPQRGGARRVGRWLTVEEAVALIESPENPRDRAVLAVLIYVGLRREEVAGLNVEQLQMAAGRWVFADVLGKGRKVRTAGVPGGCLPYLTKWIGGRTEGPLFLGSKGRLTANGIWRIVKKYGGPDLAPHDLRRTHAALARKGGAELEKVRDGLGHVSLATTEKYLARVVDLERTSGDFIGRKKC